MAISPPSDIVLDVARAAEPASVEAARAALMKRVSAGANAVAEIFSPGETAPTTTATPTTKSQAAEPFRKFEAMVLQQFVQTMLPAQDSAVYGKGLAGDMWKSMMAEKIANVMAERGGIGIADRILGDHYMKGERAAPVGPVSNSPDRAELDQQSNLSSALIDQLQLRIARALTGPTDANDAETTAQPASGA